MRYAAKTVPERITRSDLRHEVHVNGVGDPSIAQEGVDLAGKRTGFDNTDAV